MDGVATALRQHAHRVPEDIPVLWWTTLEEWHRMIDRGELRKEDRVELIHGAVIEMEPISARHSNVVTVLIGHFAGVGGRPWDVQSQGPLALPGEDVEPQPDLALVSKERRRDVPPPTASLVVEVAVSSQRMDRDIKAPMYARAGVPEYWLVDVLGQRLEVRTRPVDGEYRELRVLGEEDVVRPTAVDAPPLRVADLFA